ncbi:NADH-quinone oxidoreductase subunit J [Adhaeribacter aerolatus]|uniref:NADH-quinone oxidoreductase subunit J n=1 Tax=Adhaeribacter aerolatus TaxID=670289 RepID=A0A512B5Q6_9BACT|nr:NADH-quinone oxidoreductase subunit J [Adhaeribacter aerolatus]GEO07271.1 NADH-quinone oxidoreductase subunit J [Adhaeribacter aerolatus]
MSLVLIFFYVFGFLAIASAAFMLATKNVLYAAFGLLVTLLSLAAIFILLFADFVAITQLMVYVGGVLVLILFGVMLSNQVQGRAVQSESVNGISGGLVASAIFGGLAYLILSADYLLPEGITVADAAPANTKSSIIAIGIRLITNFALPFEVASLILLIALMGAAYISTEDKHE